MAQTLVRPVLPAHHDPFVQEVLQVCNGPDGIGLYVRAPVGNASARVAGQVLAEQGIDGGKSPLHDCLIGRGQGPGRLHGDAEGLAGGQESVGQEHLPSVAGDGLGHDHRAGRCLLQAAVQAHEAGVRELGVGHGQGLGPARAEGRGDQHAGEQQGGIDRFGGHRAEHCVAQAAGGHVDTGRQFHPPDHAVVEHGHDVKRSGVDLDHLTRPGGGGPGKGSRRPVCLGAPGGGVPEGVAAAVHHLDKAVERGRRGHRHRPGPVLSNQGLLHASTEPRLGPGRAVLLVVDGGGDGVDEAGVGPAVRAHLAKHPLVHQPPQPLGPVAAAHPLDRLRAGLPAGSRELGRLGRLPLADGAFRWVVPVWLRGPVIGARRPPGIHLDDMALPLLGPLQHFVGELLQQADPGQPGPRAAAHQLEVGRGQEMREQDHAGLPGDRDQADRRAGQASHGVLGPVEDDPVAKPEDSAGALHLRPRLATQATPRGGPPPARP